MRGVAGDGKSVPEPKLSFSNPTSQAKQRADNWAWLWELL